MSNCPPAPCRHDHPRTCNYKYPARWGLLLIFVDHTQCCLNKSKMHCSKALPFLYPGVLILTSLLIITCNDICTTRMTSGCAQVHAVVIRSRLAFTPRPPIEPTSAREKLLEERAAELSKREEAIARRAAVIEEKERAVTAANALTTQQAEQVRPPNPINAYPFAYVQVCTCARSPSPDSVPTITHKHTPELTHTHRFRDRSA